MCLSVGFRGSSFFMWHTAHSSSVLYAHVCCGNGILRETVSPVCGVLSEELAATHIRAPEHGLEITQGGPYSHNIYSLCDWQFAVRHIRSHRFYPHTRSLFAFVADAEAVRNILFLTHIHVLKPI